MKAVMVMFDTLNRRMLPPYGCDWTHAPHFARLAERTATFENCYGGSMPCIPARRDLHTGRYNFLHRSWGPLEPFDDSVPEILRRNGVYTHLVTDHNHYWEDGGATYHSRYSSFEFFRGQEGDQWKGEVADPEIPEGPTGLKPLKAELWRQDWVNRKYMADVRDHSQTLTFDAGLEFVATNAAEDRWFLQVETFDPHEPFLSYAEHKKHYPHDWDGGHFDWPDYTRVTEPDAQVEHGRLEYAALLTMCDQSLGRVLDAMDQHGLWDDTMLIVCTDHGLMLGEHGWWGKNVQPWYDETIHTPLFIWDPRAATAGERRRSPVQTMDLGPTLLEFFGVDRTEHMQGRPLGRTVASDEPVRDSALFGIFGGHVCFTDGRYVYMRAPKDASNSPLHEHTLMPMLMRGLMTPEQLAPAVLDRSFRFTKGAPVLKLPATNLINPYAFGTLLFDLATDPDQLTPLVDDELELRLATRLRDLMIESEAPGDQYERMGLPASGPLTADHLLARSQHPQALAGMQPAPRAEDFPAGPLSLHSTLADLQAAPAARAVLARHLPGLLDGPFAAVARQLTPLQIAGMVLGLLPDEALHAAAADLTAL